MENKVYQDYLTANQWLQKNKQDLLNYVTVIDPAETPMFSAMSTSATAISYSGALTETTWAGTVTGLWQAWDEAIATSVLPQSPNGGPKNAWMSPYAIGVDLVGTYLESPVQTAAQAVDYDKWKEAIYKAQKKEKQTKSTSLGYTGMLVNPMQHVLLQGIPSLPSASAGTDLKLTVSTQLKDIPKVTFGSSPATSTKPKETAKGFLASQLKKLGLG